MQELYTAEMAISRPMTEASNRVRDSSISVKREHSELDKILKGQGQDRHGTMVLGRKSASALPSGISAIAANNIAHDETVQKF